MMKKVKCIRIDAEKRELYFVEREMPIGDFIYPPGFSKGEVMIDVDLSLERQGKASDTVDHCMYYKEGSLSDPNDIPRFGFHWRTQDLNEAFDVESCSHTPVVGNGLIVGYKRDGKNRTHKEPCDVELSLETVWKMVPEFNNGVLWKLPDFTCILNESFSSPGYEVLLRIENEGLLYGYREAYQLTKPVRMLSPQIINFEFSFHEVTIITGRIGAPEDNVRIVIFETDRTDLRQIAAVTLAARKIPQWIQNRLQDHFFEKMIAESFREKVSRDRKSSLARQSAIN
jgi:hypothetical protein